MNEFYMIPNSKNLDKFQENLILPLEGYSIGFDVYFTCEEIILYSSKRNVSVIINSFLHKKEIDKISSLINSMSSVKYFFVEDLGLTNLIDKSKLVLFQNHIINNYFSVNYFKELNISNVVVSNELTTEELETISAKSQSNLFYFLINKNNLMYSKRKLISSFFDYKDIHSSKRKFNITEQVSKKNLIIKEESIGTSIFDSNIFSGNMFIDKLSSFKFIINFSNMNLEETNVILEHYKDKNLSDFINVDNYFLLNKIGYKVGDLK